MTAGHSKDSISRIASCHGIARDIRDQLYEVDDGWLTFAEVCKRLNETPSIIRQSVDNQQDGNDLWLSGNPWLRLTTHPDADVLVDPDDEFPEIEVIELTEAGRKAAQKDVTEVDPAYQTGVGFSKKGRSV